MDIQQNNTNSEETIDIRKFLISILRNWYWFAISIFITYIIAFLINRYTEPVYSVSATLLINDEKKSTAELLINALDRYSARKNVDNEIAIMKSYKMACLTLNELPDFNINFYSLGRVRTSLIYKSAPFTVIADTLKPNPKGAAVYITILNNEKYLLNFTESGNSLTEYKFGVPYIDNNFSFTLFLKPGVVINTGKNANNKFMFMLNDKFSLAMAYQQKLGVSVNDKKGTVLTLSTTGLDPQMEVDYINKLMEVYIRYGLEEKNQTAINTINFIDDQLNTVVDSLKRAEDKLQNFRLRNRVVDITSEGTAIMTKLEKVQTDKAQIELQLRYYKYLQDYIKKKKDFREVVAPSVMGIEDPLLNNTVGEIAKLFGDRSVMALNAQHDNPAIVLLNAKIQSAMDALQENIREIIATANISMDENNRHIEEIEKQIAQLPVTERGLVTIERDFKLNDNIYNFLLQKRADAAIARASNVADNKILDEAMLLNTQRIAPKTSRNKMMAIIIGILIPLSILIIIEFFNEKIMDPKDLEKITKIPIYGTIGHNEKISEIPVSDNPKSALAESFRALRTNLQYVNPEKTKKIICITSTISGEGKTFCAVNLASIIAQSNKKTLLVSLDLRKPKVHKIFNVENEIGLSTFLIDRNNFKDIVVKTNLKNLYITPAGPVPPNPAELIETSKMEEFIRLAKEEFDIIILDTPPIAIVTDALLLSRFSDAVIFVVRQNYSTKDVGFLVDDLHYKKGVKNLGILINDVKINSYYGYGKKYGYGYGYGGYGYGYTYSDEDYYGETIGKMTLTDKIVRFLFRS